MALRIEIITDRERFTEIKRQWDALWHSCGADIFRSHAWIAAWLGACAGRVAPLIAVAWDADDILAAVPFAISRRVGLRMLEWSAQLWSDYCDALAKPEGVPHLPQLWKAVWQAGGFDLVNLWQLRPDAVMRPFLDGIATAQTMLEYRDRHERCFGIDCIWPNSEAWFRSLGKKGRNNFWRGERILADFGGEVAFNCVDPGERSIEHELQYTLALKRKWLRTMKLPSTLSGREGAALESMLSAASGSGVMRLFLLSCGDRIAAASVNFVYGDTMQAYLTSYDPAFERASPGMILIVRYTRWAFDNGLRKVDFLRGDEPFKSRISNTSISLNNYAGARTPAGRVALTAHRWLSRLRERGKGEGAPGTPAHGSPHLARNG